MTLQLRKLSCAAAAMIAASFPIACKSVPPQIEPPVVTIAKVPYTPQAPEVATARYTRQEPRELQETPKCPREVTRSDDSQDIEGFIIFTARSKSREIRSGLGVAKSDAIVLFVRLEVGYRHTIVDGIWAQCGGACPIVFDQRQISPLSGIYSGDSLPGVGRAEEKCIWNVYISVP